MAEVPLSRLSEADQQHVQAFLKHQAVTQQRAETNAPARSIGDRYGAQGRYAEAAEQYLTLLDGSKTPLELLYCAPVFIKASRTDTYETLRNMAINRFGRVEHPTQAERLIGACLLTAPDARFLRRREIASLRSILLRGAKDEDL